MNAKKTTTDRLIMLDTETTGLSPQSGDRIVELGCVELIARHTTGRNLHLYFNPEREVPEEVVRVHGLTTEFLSDKPLFSNEVQRILDYLRGAHLVIHNAAFDVGFLDSELARLNLPPLREHVAGVTDTLALAKTMFPGKRNSLDALCQRLGVDNTNRTLHGALLDAQLLAQVYIQMTRGQNTLLMDDEAEFSATQPHNNASTTTQAADTPSLIDLRQVQLPVLKANETELAAHAAVLASLDKASAGKTLWTRMQVQ